MHILMAMDKKSVRTKSPDGFLHVAVSHISKANVCPYRGAEIPNGEELGLDPEAIYYLLRDPEELAKAAPTFNNLPILSRHVPVTSSTFPEDLICGSTGTDAAYRAPYLDNSLVFWTDDAIAGVESDEIRELSSAYHYTAEMTPGEFEGLRYHGIMRNICGNHVAPVSEGRAGSDVLVMDSKLEPQIMAEALKSRKAILVYGAVAAHIRPKLAADAKVDLTPVMMTITGANYKSRKAQLIAGINKATKGKLAADATLEDVTELLDALEDVTDGDVDDDAIAEAVAAPAPVSEEDDAAAVDADGDMIAKLMAFLQGKLSDEDMAAATELVGSATNDPPAEDVGGEPKEPKITGMAKTGMDAKTIRAGAMADFNAIRVAEREVRPYVGELAVAMDSAAAVYKFALDAAKVDVKGVHPSAYRAMVGMLPKPGETPRSPAMAQDGAEGANDFADMFPTARAPKRM